MKLFQYPYQPSEDLHRNGKIFPQIIYIKVDGLLYWDVELEA